VSDAGTPSQKRQRAFAQEFLCPIADLAKFVEDWDDPESEVEEAGKHFGVSTWVVRGALQNNGLRTWTSDLA
jgi:hypothetical protein